MPVPKIDRTLLNPKFEGYKLDPINQEDAVSRYPLEHRPKQAVLSGRSLLSFQEVQSRIQHNHIAVSTTGKALYVDEDLRIIFIELDEGPCDPRLRVVHALPQAIHTQSSEAMQREYPSASWITGSTWLVADGFGTAQVLDITTSEKATVMGTYELSPSSQTSPFKIHSSTPWGASEALAVLSSISRDAPQNTETSHRAAGQSTVEFDVRIVRIPLVCAHEADSAQPLDVVWHGRALDPPTYTAYDAARQAFLVMLGSPCRQIDAPALPSYEPSPDEYAPVPRADENLDGPAHTSPPKPPPYYWTQSSDSITVTFPLPSSLNKGDFKIALAPRSLTLIVPGDPAHDVPLPHFSLRQLWAGIQASTSYWTWERGAGEELGLLTFYLDKQHEGTRWSHVFAASSSANEAEVPETLDPSEFANIRESLEKYTAAMREGKDASGLGLGTGVPSLGQGEMDEDVDDSIGRQIFLSWIGINGASQHEDDTHIDLLSTPLPGALHGPLSVVAKVGLDGVLLVDDAVNREWHHNATFSALSFVLASKRDTRFTFHVSSTAVLAFDSGGRNGRGNLYVYRGCGKEKWAKQALVQVGDSSSGALLGVAAVHNPPVILCLCERQLVIVRNLF